MIRTILLACSLTLLSSASMFAECKDGTCGLKKTTTKTDKTICKDGACSKICGVRSGSCQAGFCGCIDGTNAFSCQCDASCACKQELSATQKNNNTDDSKCAFCGGQGKKDDDNQENKSPCTHCIKRKADASQVLETMADACSNAGQAVGAQSKEEKHQALFNLVGSVLNLASQCIKKDTTKQSVEEKRLKHELIKKTTKEIIEALEKDEAGKNVLADRKKLTRTTKKQTRKATDRDKELNRILTSERATQDHVSELLKTVEKYLETTAL